MEENLWRNKTKPSSTELLRGFLEQWAALYGKTLNEKAIEVWLGIFCRYDVRVLAPALSELTESIDRWPMPGHLTKIISRLLENKPWLSRSYHVTPKASEGKDKDGVPCWYWSDKPNEPTYRAVDCSEGLVFLAEFAKLSGKTQDECARLMEKWTCA